MKILSTLIVLALLGSCGTPCINRPALECQKVPLP